MRQLAITKCGSSYFYKVRELVITKCDSYFVTNCDKCYYKGRQVLQSVTILLQSATGVTKCVDYNKVRQNRCCLLVLILDCITRPAKNKILYLSDHVFVVPADPTQEGTVTGEVSGAAASTRDTRHSTEVRSARKRKYVEQGTYNSWS